MFSQAVTPEEWAGLLIVFLLLVVGGVIVGLYQRHKEGNGNNHENNH